MTSKLLSDTISTCRKHLEDTNQIGTKIEHFLSEFLLITIHREYELSIKESFMYKINKSKDKEIISYIVNMTKRKTSIQREELGNNLSMFNKTYRKKFNDQLKPREISHYDSIVSNRITVAHKEPVMITIKDLMEWHVLAQNVPKKFSYVLLDGNVR